MEALKKQSLLIEIKPALEAENIHAEQPQALEQPEPQWFAVWHWLWHGRLVRLNEPGQPGEPIEQQHERRELEQLLRRYL